MFIIKGEPSIKINTWIVLVQIALVYLFTVITFIFIEGVTGLELESLNVATYHLLIIYILVRAFRIKDISLLQVTGALSVKKEPWFYLLGILVTLKLFSFFSQSIGAPIISIFYPEIYNVVFASNLDVEVEINLNIILMIVISFTLGPIIEELFFRAYLLNKWGSKLGAGKAIILSSLLFALLHFNLILFLPYFLVGVFYSIAYLKTKKLIVPIILHAVSNFISGVTDLTPAFKFSSPEQLQQAANIGAILCIILLPIVCLMLYRYYRGTSKVLPFNANQNLVA